MLTPHTFLYRVGVGWRCASLIGREIHCCVLDDAKCEQISRFLKYLNTESMLNSQKKKHRHTAQETTGPEIVYRHGTHQRDGKGAKKTAREESNREEADRVARCRGLNLGD